MHQRKLAPRLGLLGRTRVRFPPTPFNKEKEIEMEILQVAVWIIALVIVYAVAFKGSDGEQ